LSAYKVRVGYEQNSDERHHHAFIDKRYIISPEIVTNLDNIITKFVRKIMMSSRVNI